MYSVGILFQPKIDIVLYQLHICYPEHIHPDYSLFWIRVPIPEDLPVTPKKMSGYNILDTIRAQTWAREIGALYCPNMRSYQGFDGKLTDMELLTLPETPDPGPL